VIQVPNVSFDGQGQGVTIHVIEELWEKEADLSESFLWPLRLFFQHRIAAHSACHNQKKNTDEKTLSNTCHDYRESYSVTSLLPRQKKAMGFARG
jgi:hypothetical protein